ncbi:MAG: nucleotidyltransferase family protein [Solirubrobacterales bacterium]|nr:nucleotidyltransferase family protein [Solirubrobacterales bacterium]
MRVLRPEEALLIATSYSEPTQLEIAEARNVAPMCNWSHFRALVFHNETAPLARHNLARMDLLRTLPDELQEELDEAYASVEARNMSRLEITKKLLELAGERGIQIVILKGSLFALEIYKDIGYKKMSDLDVLVAKDDLDGLYEIYQSLGLISDTEMVAGDPRAQEDFSHHWPPFSTPDRLWVVGTHWGLTNPKRRYRLDIGRMWERTREIDFHGVPAYALAAEDNLHHLGVHLHYYKTGIRELADIYNLVRHAGDRLDWSMLDSEVTAAGTCDPIFHALALANAVAPDQRVTRLLEARAPEVSRLQLWDVRRKIRNISRLLWSRSTHLDIIEEAYTEFTRTDSPEARRKLYSTATRALCCPPAEEAVRLHSVGRRSRAAVGIARLAAPVRLGRVLCNELSARIFWSILVKTTLVIAVEHTAPGRQWIRKR